MVETEGQKVIVSSNTKEKWVKGSGTFILLFKKTKFKLFLRRFVNTMKKKDSTFY